MAVRLLSKLKVLPEVRGVTFATAAPATATLSDFDAQHKTPVVRKQAIIPVAHYGGRHLVTMLPGGGIGPECMGHVRDIFKYVGAPIDFERVDIDPTKDNDDDVQYAITTIKRNGVAIKGNIETKSEASYVTSRNVALRNELDMYAYVINCKSYPGVSTRHKDIDLVIVRQNTEGEYAMLEHESVYGVIESMKVVTATNSERVARFAFEYAKKNGRKKVTTVHKANIMKLSDGLFLETAKRIAKEYPELEHNDMIIDNCCMQLVAKPHQFDVMLMTNLYGSIVSNVVCGLLGGAGIFSGRNYGQHYAVFEPGTRNTGTAIAGKNLATPLAMINASVDMLEHLGHHYHADLIRRAVEKTINVDKVLTPDCGGTASSSEVVNSIIHNIGSGVQPFGSIK
ncbi:isocitrate dehydrogenase [NAD] subunit gamma, mitochondrial isoform X2 [Plutella xylostella]|uniref:isocitrate dehydrogenase [NAD] subunit gamma, mitochondrial isoform X2 n=1 Tax=Plutella xylostella TaxID=51655 RepID=UPI0020328AC9|nr:isocitrate dehydrogenase [NAD] subunit gamma, mitochondrial isoform X2 [Plutella xylostella]